MDDKDVLVNCISPSLTRMADGRIYGQRTVLACAISKDAGKTWGLPKALETNPELWSEYPGVTFDGDHALVYCRVFPSDRKRCDLNQARVPLSWFYDSNSN